MSKNVENWFDAASNNDLRGLNNAKGLLSYLKYIELYLDLESSSNKYILDFGCGDGILLRMLAQKYPQHKFHGIDISSVLIEKAHAREKVSNLSFSVLDPSTVECNPSLEKYDLIFSFSVLQYIPTNKISSLHQNLFKMLKSKGRIIHLSVPDIKNRFKILKQEREKMHGKNWFNTVKSFAKHLKTLILMDEFFNKKDQSYFHHPEKLQQILKPSKTRIKSPSDSWYRFDIEIQKS